MAMGREPATAPVVREGNLSRLGLKGLMLRACIDVLRLASRTEEMDEAWKDPDNQPVVAVAPDLENKSSV